MSQKWNLQDIRPREEKRRRPVKPEPSEATQGASEGRTDQEQQRIPVENGTKRSHRALYAVGAMVLLIGAGIVGISTLLTGADVTVYPKHRTPTVNASVTAYPEERTDELAYEIMTLTATGEDQVTATGEEAVSERAEGTIEIIKSTPGTQQLVENTRFESPDGLIFRSTSGVEVPGAVTEEDGSTTPGSVRVDVVADEPGEAYNLPEGTRFTIPGFAEGGFTELYESMYGENRSEFTHGYEGERFVIEPDELSTARQALQVELRDQLLGQVDSERPANFVLFQDSVTFTYEMLPAVEYGDDLVTIKEEVTLRAPIFDRDQFAAYIAAASVPTYDDNTVRIDNLDEISFEYADESSIVNDDISDRTSLEFDLVGNPEIVWTFDEAVFKDELAGEQKDALRFIVNEYAAIEEAEARIQPFWRQTYPDDTDLITVTEVLDRQ